MKTNIDIINYAKGQLGKPYWFGTYGQVSTKALYDAKKKQYPKYYTAKDYPNQYGKKVHDCAGLIKGALWCDSATDKTPTYNAKQDYGATGLYDHCTKKGKYNSKITLKKGTLVFKGTDKTKSHVGIFIGGNYVIEAKGHAYGVVKTKLSTGGWKYYGESNLFKYIDDPDEKVTEYTVNVKTYLALRSAPKITGKLLAKMKNGDKFMVSEISDGWGYGTYNGVKGWANMKYLK